MRDPKFYYPEAVKYVYNYVCSKTSICSFRWSGSFRMRDMVAFPGGFCRETGFSAHFAVTSRVHFLPFFWQWRYSLAMALFWIIKRVMMFFIVHSRGKELSGVIYDMLRTSVWSHFMWVLVIYNKNLNSNFQVKKQLWTVYVVLAQQNW